MDLNARVDVNFSRVDVNFQTVTVTYFCNIFFKFNIGQHQGPTYTPYKISAKYSDFGEMDLNARVDVIFLGSA